MSATPVGYSPQGQGAFGVVLRAGLIAGALDLTAAIVTFGLRGVRPIRIPQSIASGLLGASAYEGGFSTAALGVLLHFIIAFGAALVYYLASRRLRFLVRWAVVCGLLYGIAVYLFMNLVVLPLSAFPGKISFQPSVQLLTGVVTLMLCVGLPIALVVRRYSK
jgi:uncharacterized membrane protein YagU involved in acid resistance